MAGFVTPDPSTLTYDPYLGSIRMADTGYGTLANPFPATGLYWYDTTGALWLVTIDATGHLVTTSVPAMIGPWLSLGLTNIQHT